MTCGAVEFKVQRRVYVDMSRQEERFPTDNKTIWGLLALKNGGRSVFLDTSSRFIVRGFYHGRGSEILNLSPAKMAGPEGNPLLFFSQYFICLVPAESHGNEGRLASSS